MTLRPVSDLSAAHWLFATPQPWWRLATFGPAGFPAYARLRYLPDPERPGQAEGDVEGDPALHGHPLQVLSRLIRVLAHHTSTPDDTYHCLWEGIGDLRGDGVPRVQPAFPPEVLDGPMVRTEHRSWYLFRGGLSDLGDWGAADGLPGRRRDDLWPALVWPADRAWCVAADVDPHWAGIGGSEELVTELLRAADLDVVRADPTQQQPSYG